MKNLPISIVSFTGLMLLLTACASHRPRCESLQPINVTQPAASQLQDRVPDETSHES